MNRSHTLQAALNYFDAEDTRVREQGATLDAQLLNTAAVAMDDVALKHARERDAATPLRSALHLDNGGIWYLVRPPSSYNVPSVSGTIYGSLGDQTFHLQPYDDLLPVPRTVERDPGIAVVSMPDPLLFDLDGSGQVLSVSGATFPIPVPLYVWLDAPGVDSPQVELLLEGEPYPAAAWPNDRQQQRERFVVGDGGLSRARTLWASLTRITVRGLEVGWRLRAWRLPVNLPAVSDPDRPVTVPGFRDVTFGRLWTLEDGLLKENYWRSNLSGIEYLQSYALNVSVCDLVVEPRTWGLYTIDGSHLYYWDRREPFPSRLTETGMTTTPAYGLHVSWDSCRGALRVLELDPVNYSGTGCAQWRLSVDDPAGVRHAIAPNGVLAPYDYYAGWRRGIPATVRFAMATSGDYLFRLETMDSAGRVTTDVCPWINPAWNPNVTLDLSTLVPSARGITLDALSRLWVWTGDWAIALKPRYHGYILDPDHNLVYVTEPYSKIQFA